MSWLANRRRIAIGSNKAVENPYITNGLFLWLDGINRGTTDNDKWVDLINGYEFVGSGISWGTNHLICPNEMVCSNFPTFDASTPIGTLEVVFVYDGNVANPHMFQPKGHNNGTTTGFPCCGIYSSYYYLSCSNESKRTYGKGALSNGSMHRMSVNYNYLVIDGAAKSFNSYKDKRSAYSSGARIGLQDGKIFSIRCYNRELTEAEMIANQAKDAIRFAI